MSLHHFAGFGSAVALFLAAGGALGQVAPPPAGAAAAPAAAAPAAAAPAAAAPGGPMYAAPAPGGDDAARPAPPPPPQAAPGIYVEQPPLPPPAPRTRHLHDGFYLRLSAGFGAMAVESERGSVGDGSVRGAGAAFDLTLGGTPTPGLVIGGGLLYQEAFKPEFSGTAGNGDEDSVGFALVGPMIDAFPDPNGGFHFGGLMGPAWVGLGDQKDNASSGFGLSVWAGYMWWVSSQWSLGGLVRLSGARTVRTVSFLDPAGNEMDEDLVDTTRAYSIMFSAAFH